MKSSSGASSMQRRVRKVGWQPPAAVWIVGSTDLIISHSSWITGQTELKRQVMPTKSGFQSSMILRMSS